MKVKCIQITNFVTGEKQTSSPYLTIGKSYIVLSILISESKIDVRIIDNSRSPGLFRLSDFEIIDNSLPSNWRIENDKGFISIAPQKWLELGFWEKYYDDDPIAMEIFQTEYEKIIKESV